MRHFYNKRDVWEKKMRASELAPLSDTPSLAGTASLPNPSANSGPTTRSRARRTPQRTINSQLCPPTGPTPASRSALSALIHLFSDPFLNTPNTGSPPTNLDDDGASLSSEVSSLSSSSINPEAPPFVLDSIREEEDASPQLSADKALQGQVFDATFGLAGNPEEECRRLEQRRRQLLSQDLEES